MSEPEKYLPVSNNQLYVSSAWADYMEKENARLKAENDRLTKKNLEWSDYSVGAEERLKRVEVGRDKAERENKKLCKENERLKQNWQEMKAENERLKEQGETRSRMLHTWNRHNTELEEKNERLKQNWQELREFNLMHIDCCGTLQRKQGHKAIEKKMQKIEEREK
jgi:hypothetical protein